jgi:hypothetical protein
MTDGEHLYRAILDNPADDTLRLAYADWLDETAGVGTCPTCGGTGCTDRYHGCADPGHRCPDCDGTGSSPDGRHERAEFIRVQVELAALEVTSNPRSYWCQTSGCRHCELERRERELFDANLCRWESGRVTPDCAYRIPGRGNDDTAPVMAIYRRGFVAEIRLTAAAFLGEVCAFCEGRGHFQSSGSYAECPRCRGPLGTGTGRTPGLAKALFAAHPITKVVLTNKSPEETPSGWSWFDHGFADDSATITPDLFRHLSDTDGAHPGLLSARMTFATREAALDALSVALVAYGRRLAGVVSREATV